jgi:hypothetical protein
MDERFVINAQGFEKNRGILRKNAQSLRIGGSNQAQYERSCRLT